MQITSPAWADRGTVPARYTCDGENISPPLAFADVPEEAESLVLIVDDPDGAEGVWVHWVVWNIDPATQTTLEAAVPGGGAEGMTSFGVSGYGGPCPASGRHRYVFKLYALDMRLDLPPETEAAQLEAAMVGHVAAQAELTGRYSR